LHSNGFPAVDRSSAGDVDEIGSEHTFESRIDPTPVRREVTGPDRGAARGAALCRAAGRSRGRGVGADRRRDPGRRPVRQDPDRGPPLPARHSTSTVDSNSSRADRDRAGAVSTESNRVTLELRRELEPRNHQSQAPGPSPNSVVDSVHEPSAERSVEAVSPSAGADDTWSTGLLASCPPACSDRLPGTSA
jgi:hypothetical protein